MDNFEAAFQRHLEATRSSRSLRFKQAFFNVRRFYFIPLAIGLTGANFVADAFVRGENDPVTWVTIFLAVTPLLAAVAYRFVVKDKAFDSQRHFLMEALKLTLADQESSKQ